MLWGELSVRIWIEHPDAQTQPRRYYSEVGIGVKADLDEAKMWYLRAAGLSRPRILYLGTNADLSFR